ncbi:MAG TPA: hypothetical protein PKA10_07900 [Selenomonadales bacterium]|nr:hypothetical protein [Selenomonadales bacterium]
MKQQEMLHVDWNDRESATYYVDKDKYSKAHRITPSRITLSAYEGTCTFDEETGGVTLDTGAAIKIVKVKRWKAYFTPEP